MVNKEGGSHIKQTSMPEGFDQKEIEFIMESPNGQLENQTLQKFLNEKFEQISELANINLMQLEKDVLAKKMLGCIDMINEVLKSNISMREQVKNYAIALDQ